MKRLLFFLLTVPVLYGAGNFNCANNSGDAASIQSIVNGGGANTVAGPCLITSQVTINSSNTSLTGTGTSANWTIPPLNTAQSGALWTASSNGMQMLAINPSAANVTVTGIDFDQGGVVVAHVITNFNFTHNKIANMTNSGGIPDGMQTNGMIGGSVLFNVFDNIMIGGYSDLTSQYPTYPGPIDSACWADYPGTTSGDGGLSGTVVQHNSFTRCGNDGFHINPNGTNTAQSVISISYNYCALTHRACFEIQTPLGNAGLDMRSNIAINANAPFYDTFAYSIATNGNFGEIGITFYNNLGSLNTQYCEGGVASFLEIGSAPGTVQGNVNMQLPIAAAGNPPPYPPQSPPSCYLYSSGGSSSYSVTFIAASGGNGTTSPLNTVTTQNNVMCGNSAVTGFDNHDGSSGARNIIDQYNYKNTTSCPGRTFVSSNVGTPVFTSPNNQSFPSGGNGTWSLTEISGLPVSNVSFYIDSSSTPIVLQEIQDVSTTFASDQKWLYHATINTSSLSSGSHTIKAIATDVLGGTAQASQTFTTGSGGPGASFSPATLSYGTVTVGTTSPAQFSTLTNTGTTTLTISSAPSIGGANPGDFAITGTTCGSTLAASATCTVTVTFTPTVTGSRSAQVMISDNAAGSPHSFQLTGGASNCLAGNILPSQCDFNAGPNALSTNGGPWGFSGGIFGTVQVDNTGPGGVFAAHITATASVPPGNNIELFYDGLTFPNNGTMMQLTASCAATPAQGVNILGILSTSPFTSYGLSWQPVFQTSFGSSVPNCKSPFFKVQGTPTSGSGRLTFQADGAGPGSQVYITNVNLVPVGSVPASQPSVSSVAFGTQAVGTTQTGSPITVTNGGVAGLVISSIAPATGNTGDFGVTSNSCITTIAPGSTCTFTPTFTPSATGVRNTNFVITSNDTSTSPQSIPASGTGTAGSTEVTSIFPILVSHGSVYLGFTTQTNSTAVRVRYSVTGCASGTGGLVQTNFLNNISAVFAALPVGGLTHDATYHICVEPSKDGGSTWISGGPELVVTMLPLPFPHPALPIPPLIFNTAYPNTSGYTNQTANSTSTFSSVYRMGCTNWTAGTGQIITVAAGTVMQNPTPFAFTCTPPDIHTVAVSDVTLPSTITWNAHGFSEGDLIEFGRTYGLSVTYPAGGGCDTGQGTTATVGIQSGQRYPVHVVDANHIQPRCLPTTFIADTSATVPTPPIMVWTASPTASGSDHMVAVAYKSTGTDTHGKPIWQRRMPTSPYAVTPQFIIQTNGVLPPEHTQLTSAWVPNLFQFQANASNYISSAAFQHPFIVFGNADPNVEIPTGPYRLVGAEVTTENYSTVSSDPYFWSTLIWTHPWDDQIIWDRCYYHIPDGNREYRGMQWDGSNMGWVDSAFDNLVYMKSAVVGLGVTGGGHTINITAGSNYIPNLSHYTLASNETVTLTGTGSGRVRIYWDQQNSGAFTASVPTGITASCSPTSCTQVSSSAAGVGACLPTINPTTSATYADLPHYSSGESSAASVGCADLTSGSITTAGAYNTSVSQWNAEGDSHMIGGVGPGPYYFCDNFYDGAGIIWHFDDSGGFGFRGNYTWCRNYGKTSTKWMYGSPDSLNMIAGNRQQLEWKAGQYIEIKGNVFDGSYRDVIPDSAALAFQPLNGGQVTDVNMVSNTIKNGSALLQGPTNTCGGTATSCGLAMRIHMDNTLDYNINGYFFTSPDVNGSNGPGLGWLNQFQAIEDPFTEHQTDGTPNRGATSWLLSNTSVAVEGYTDDDSIHWFSGVPSQVSSMFGDGSGQAQGVPPGCQTLSNFALMQCQFTPFFNFQNLMLGGYIDNSTATGQSNVSTMTTAFGSLMNSYLATGTVSGTTNTVNWTNPSIDSHASYHLAWNSPYSAGANAITHTGPLGIEPDRLDADQGLLKMGSMTYPSGVPTINYFAADSQVCHVGVSTTNSINTISASPYADAGGARPRAVGLTGLTSGTVYYGWVMCPGNANMSQRSFQFKAH